MCGVQHACPGVSNRVWENCGVVQIVESWDLLGPLGRATKSTASASSDAGNNQG